MFVFNFNFWNMSGQCVVFLPWPQRNAMRHPFLIGISQKRAGRSNFILSINWTGYRAMECNIYLITCVNIPGKKTTMKLSYINYTWMSPILDHLRTVVAYMFLIIIALQCRELQSHFKMVYHLKMLGSAHIWTPDLLILPKEQTPDPHPPRPGCRKICREWQNHRRWKRGGNDN